MCVGDPIQSERTFSKTYDVSRFTVRRAVSDLVKEGTLRRASCERHGWPESPGGL